MVFVMSLAFEKLKLSIAGIRSSAAAMNALTKGWLVILLVYQLFIRYLLYNNGRSYEFRAEIQGRNIFVSGDGDIQVPRIGSKSRFMLKKKLLETSLYMVSKRKVKLWCVTLLQNVTVVLRKRDNLITFIPLKCSQVQMIMAYILMLIVMEYNVNYLIATALGFGLGHHVFRIK